MYIAGLQKNAMRPASAASKVPIHWIEALPASELHRYEFLTFALAHSTTGALYLRHLIVRCKTSFHFARSSAKAQKNRKEPATMNWLVSDDRGGFSTIECVN